MNDPSVLAAARQFVDRCLRTDDSLFTPGRPVWSREVLADLYERFVENPDLSSDSFYGKFKRQLSEAPDDTVQLAGECLYVYFLAPVNVKHATKMTGVETVLGWAEEPVEVPEDLVQALDGGIAGCGTGYNTRRPFLLQYILELATELKGRPADERSAILDDPWRFRDLAHSIDVKAATPMREALLHLVHPETFEHIVSYSAKRRIVETFAGRVADASGNMDRRLLEIRRSLEEEHGTDVDFYRPPFVDEWQPESSRWGQFIKPSDQLLGDELLDEEEFPEGRKKRIVVNAYERDPKAREACIAQYGTSCFVCDFAFGREYGELGDGFIHVHHLKPLALRDPDHATNPSEDLRPVCPNCHAMLHRSHPPLPIRELRDLLEERRKQRGKDATS